MKNVDGTLCVGDGGGYCKVFTILRFFFMTVVVLVIMVVLVMVVANYVRIYDHVGVGDGDSGGDYGGVGEQCKSHPPGLQRVSKTFQDI